MLVLCWLGSPDECMKFVVLHEGREVGVTGTIERIPGSCLEQAFRILLDPPS